MSATEVSVKQSINRSAVNALASAIAKGLAAVNATGSLVTQVCNIARAQYRGKAIPKLDVDAVLSELAVSQVWKGRTADIRKSEYRSVLGAYDTLPEAMKALVAKTNRCTWHDGIALSRLLRGKAKGKPASAAAMHANRGKKSAVEPGAVTRGNAKAAIASFVKRVLKMTKVEREFRDALKELCLAHSIRV